jgi:hypothetical protein
MRTTRMDSALMIFDNIRWLSDVDRIFYATNKDEIESRVNVHLTYSQTLANSCSANAA